MTTLYNVRKTVSGHYTEVSRFSSPIARGFVKSRTVRSGIRAVVRRADNVARAKKRIFRLVHANECRFRPIFLTLTYKENMQDREQAVKDLARFFRLLRAHYPSIKYLYVLEKQKRGAYHAHILLFNLPWLPISFLQKLWPHGSNDVKFTNDSQHVSFYLAKYVGKDFGDDGTYSRAYNTSHGLLKPETFHYLVSHYFPFNSHHLRYEGIRTTLNGNIILTRAIYESP